VQGSPSANRWLLGAILVLSSVLRVFVADLTGRSQGDETSYVAATRFLLLSGWGAFGKLVSGTIAVGSTWTYPTPLRWGYFGLGTLTCRIVTPCDARALVWLSTVAGVGCVVGTFAVGARLVGKKAALVAAALTVSSPLQLALGRRALSDEVYCAVFLAALWSLVALLQGAEKGERATFRPLAFVALSTLAFAVKEAFVFPYAAFLCVYVVSQRRLGLRDALLLAAPPLLFFLGFVLLSGNAAGFFALLRIEQASFSSEYSLRFQGGPPHRPLFDLFLLAPIVCFGGVLAVARILERRFSVEPGVKWLAIALAVMLAAMAGLPKNARFVVVLDPILRLLAAWALVALVLPNAGKDDAPDRTRSPGLQGAVLGAAIVSNAGVELLLFRKIFLLEGVYDPTTHSLLHALGALPRTDPEPPRSLYPVVFLGIVAVAVAVFVFFQRRTPMTSPELPPAEGAKRRSTPLAIALGVAVTLAAAGGAFVMLRGRSTTPPVPAVSDPVDPAAAEMSAGLAATDPNLAAVHFRKALQINPTHYGATFQLARALELAGRRDEAKVQWEAVLRLAEQHADQPLIDAARARIVPGPPGDAMAAGLDALHAKNDPATAASRFREVLAKNPDHYGASFQLATALDRQNLPFEARPYWSKVLEMAQAINDPATAATARARLEAIDKLPKPEVDPAAEEMKLGLEALYTAHDATAAIVHFKKVLARNPSHYGATYQLAAALDEANKPVEARFYWGKVLKMAETIKDAPTADKARSRLAKAP
jgi:tetratricopeptide (TPR) repeat protein